MGVNAIKSINSYFIIDKFNNSLNIVVLFHNNYEKKTMFDIFYPFISTEKVLFNEENNVLLHFYELYVFQSSFNDFYKNDNKFCSTKLF